MKLLSTAAVAAVLTVPASAAAASLDDPPSPVDSAARAELAGHLSVGAQMRAARADVLRQRLVRRTTRLARRAARLDGRRLRGAQRERLQALPTTALRRQAHDLEDRIDALRRRAARRRAASAAPVSPHLAAIAACESGGDPRAIGGGGLYRGKYQFSLETWAAVGGSGDPAAAPEAEQDMRAAMLYAQAGASPWPVCGG